MRTEPHSTNEVDKLSAAFSDVLGRFESLPLLGKVLDYLGEEASREVGSLLPDVTFRRVAHSTGRVRAQTAVSQGGVWGILRASKDATCVLVFVNSGLRDAMVELALGGRVVSPLPPQRPGGAIEESVTRICLEALAEAASKAFTRASVGVKFTVDGVASAPSSTSVYRDNSACFVIDWQVGLGDGLFAMTLLLPQPFVSSLREVLSKASPARPSSALPQDTEWSRQIETEIKATGVDVSAVIDQRIVPLQTVAQMKVGDVLMLDVFAGSRCRIEAAEVPLFLAELGKQGSRLVLRLERPFDSDREFIAGLMAATDVSAES